MKTANLPVYVNIALSVCLKTDYTLLHHNTNP